MRLATKTPKADYFHDADTDLKLSEADPYYALVRAVIARAFWDAQGNIGTSSYKAEEVKAAIIQDAIAFFNDGWCLHFVELLGCDVDKLDRLGIE